MTLAATQHLAAHLTSPGAWDAEADDTLVCAAVIAETHDVATFVFEPPTPATFRFKPGQFLTFEFPLPDGPVNRCYTIASSPMRPHTVSITVKRVPNGPVSNWLHDHCRRGTAVKAIGPMGDFTCVDAPAAKYLFLSGGSGVTPLMSMSRAFADLGGPVDIVFVHAARSPRDIVFRQELDLMAQRLPGFRVVHLVETPGDQLGWPGTMGRISPEFLKLAAPDLATRSVFCCGPDPFMKAARTLLADLGLPAENYHQESFDFATLSAEDPAVASDVLAAEAGVSVPTYKVTFTKLGQTVDVRGDQFVLAAARDAGLRLPSSCTSGLCGTCKSKLVSGTVEMKHQGGIRQREIDNGLFLPCCSKPTSDLVVEK
ncbi:hybrid-cluster NAD(P)-dependent oxidoreductase [Chthonobacter albigriseus]|uniref:hybrid-cluster NAD(P)-dependent oxidoreductase n=1 Tax=Chthonobacter albigriseus TaxID=1683161 RepID=UPI0015EE7545|nr:hybrid-cluster NAD(P)-dependent oxidoreductase [Chthonobacter albigriseus]